MSPDLLTATGQIFLALLAWTMLFQRSTYIHPLISMLTALALGTVAVGLVQLSAPVSAAVVAACAYAWLGIFLLRGKQYGLRR